MLLSEVFCQAIDGSVFRAQLEAEGCSSKRPHIVEGWVFFAVGLGTTTPLSGLWFKNSLAIQIMGHIFVEALISLT